MTGLRYRRELPNREAVWYVAAQDDEGPLVVRCDDEARLDYYLEDGNSVRACAAKDVSKVESKVRKGDYTRAVHLVSRPEPDQQMISLLQRNFQPVHYERFDGAAVVTYKVGQHFSAGPTQPEPPSALPTEQ
jgi:hypothetical protein